MAAIALGEEHKHVAQLGMAAYRAPSLLQPHKLRQAIRDAHEGKIPPLIAFFLGFPSVNTSVVAAQMGADLCFIDWEHSSLDVESLTTIIHNVHFMSEGRCHIIVRVPSEHHHKISYAMDAGASIMVPQVDTVAKARHVIEAAKFGVANRGTRSAPPARWWLPDAKKTQDPATTVWESSNQNAAVLIQIESAKGIRNLDAILTEGGDAIDSVWLGTLDVRVSIGLDGIGNEPEFMELKTMFEATCKKHNKPISGFAFPGMWDFGKDRSIVCCAGDQQAFMSQIPVVQQARELFPPLEQPKKESVNGNGVKHETNGSALDANKESSGAALPVQS